MQFQTPSRFSAGAPMHRRRDDHVLGDMVDRYGQRGGLASTDELVHLMRPHWRQPVSVLARWIVDRKVLSFAWHGQILLPAFQFESPRMTPNQAIAECSRELGDTVDDEAFAAWFIRPDDGLGGNSPLDLLSSHPDVVIEAAARTRAAFTIRRAAH